MQNHGRDTLMTIKEAWKSKGYAFGTMLCEMYSPNVADMFAQAGMDFFIIDCEHGPFTYAEVAGMAAGARGANISPLVRIPMIEREFLLKVLEMGINGVMVPMVKTADDVRKIVEYAKYAPLGARGISTRRAHNHYGFVDMSHYFECANQETTILIQIETMDALSNLREIASVEGIDGLIVGPSDLSSALGDYGNFTTEQFKNAVAEILKVTKDCGIHCGFVTSNLKQLKEYYSNGMDTFCWNSEIGMVTSASKKAVEEFQH